MGYYFYYPPENKVLVARNAEFFENSLINQEASGSLEDLEIIKEEDTHPSINTSLHHEEGDIEIDEPQSDIIPIRRSTRKRNAPIYYHIRDIGILYSIDRPYYDYAIWQMDVKTAFLITTSLRWVYMEQPEENLATRSSMENSKRGSIPMQEKLKLSKSQGASTPAEIRCMQNVLYALAVGSIMYVVRCIRPDVVFTQNITCRFQQNLGDMKQELRVSCYTDAGYLTDADDLKSHIYCIANESGITKGARHFCAKVHYLRKVIEYGDLKLEKVHTYDNLADHFPKRLV
ncbi:hypothetical protein Tco_0445888 [Tanacetum coccineum]